jgi:rubredoxin
MLSEMLDDIRFCPVCTTDWQGKPILEKDKHLYKGATHYSRLIGVEIPEKYDGVSYWECPDCHTRWDRFTGEKIVTSQARRVAIQRKKG